MSIKIQDRPGNRLVLIFCSTHSLAQICQAHLSLSRKKKVRNQLAKRLRSYTDFKVEVLLCTFSKLSPLADYQPENIADCMKQQ